MNKMTALSKVQIASRPHGWRIVHALSIKISSIVITLPALMWGAGTSFWDAVIVDFSLSFACAAYANVFHLSFDRARPMEQRALDA